MDEEIGEVCADVANDLEADACVLMVLGGIFGSGNSVTTRNDDINGLLPDGLRQLADAIEQDNRERGIPSLTVDEYFALRKARDSAGQEPAE